MHFSLRPYRKEDFQILHSLDQSCFPPGIAFPRHVLRNYLHLPTACCQIAEGDGKLAGLVLSAHGEDRGTIITLDVAIEFRRRGVGSALLAAAEQHFAEEIIRDIEIQVSTQDAAAVAFWTHHGYRTQDTLKDYYQKGQDAYAMVKRLPINKEP